MLSRSMSTNTPLRALIAALVTVGMQLCCCSAGWLDCAACQDAGEVAVVALHDGHDPSAIGERDHHASGSEQHGNGSPCGGHDGNGENGTCTCSTQDPKPCPAELSKIDLPTPVLVAVLPIWDPIPPHALGSRELILLNQALVRPVTSLLRQHCALIV